MTKTTELTKLFLEPFTSSFGSHTTQELITLMSYQARFDFWPITTRNVQPEKGFHGKVVCREKVNIETASMAGGFHLGANVDHLGVQEIDVDADNEQGHLW